MKDCNKPRQQPQAAGYTLVEVLTAVGVLAIVSVMAYPQLSSYGAQYRLGAAANQLAFDLARARMKAVGENMYTRITFGSSVSDSFGYGRTYQLAKSDTGATFTAEATASPLPRGIMVYAFPAQVIFNRQGLANSPLTLWVANEQFQWKLVTMTSLGKVRVQ